MDIVWKSVQSLFRTKRTDTDNFVFRLHYVWTVLFLVIFALIISGRQYFGDPIQCHKRSEVAEKFAENFCWTAGTYSIASSWHSKVGDEVVYPGVDNGKAGEDNKVYHIYYQWVNFVLFIQSLFFYLPRLIWKTFECGRMRQLSLCLYDVTLSEEERNRRSKTLLQYMQRHRGKHCQYFWSFFFSEGVNFGNVLIQMFVLDAFLGRKFLSYGIDVLKHQTWQFNISYNPMVERFPRVTKCMIYTFGNSGGVQKSDVLCHLPMNILFEKIFIFLWFWFCILLTLSSVVIVYRILSIVFPQVRLRIIQLLALHTETRYLRMLVNKSDVGDWFLWSTLAQNVDALNFRDLLMEYVKVNLDQNGNID